MKKIFGIVGFGLAAIILANVVMGFFSNDSSVSSYRSNEIHSDEVYYWDITEYFDVMDANIDLALVEYAMQFQLIEVHSELMHYSSTRELFWDFNMVYDPRKDLYVVITGINPGVWKSGQVEEDVSSDEIVLLYENHIFNKMHEYYDLEHNTSSGAVFVTWEGQVLAAFDENYEAFYIYN